MKDRKLRKLLGYFKDFGDEGVHLVEKVKMLEIQMDSLGKKIDVIVEHLGCKIVNVPPKSYTYRLEKIVK